MGDDARGLRMAAIPLAAVHRAHEAHWRASRQWHPARGRAAAGLLAAAGALVLLGVGAAARGADWPQWRGPDRTGVTAEPSGYPAGWPPARLWEANVGKGCTSPVVAGGRVYVMGWHGEADTVRCLDAKTGAEAWKQSYRARYQARQATGDESAYGGPSSTPTLDAETGWLYTLGVDGDLRCWDTRREGKGVWGLNLYETFQVQQRENVGPPDGRGHRDYGFTSGPLVLGDLVIIEVGAKEGTVIAFEKRTGRPRWRSEYADCAGQSGGPATLTVQGMPCLVTLALKHMVVMRTDAGHEGRTVAAFPWATDFANNIATPAVAGGRLVVTSAYNQSRTALLDVAPGAMRERWSVRDHAGVASPVVHQGCAYLVDAALVCLDLETGKRLWKGGAFGHGTCLVTGDGKVLAFGNAKLVLAEAAPGAKAYRELARVDDLVPATCYPHVALAEGRIACKDMDGNLVMLSVRPEDRRAAGEAPPRPPEEAQPPGEPAPAEGLAALHDAPAPKMGAAWPGNAEGLEFVWADAKAENRVRDAAGKGVRECAVKARGEAKTDERGAMALGAGAWLAEAADAALLAACKRSNQLAIEAIVTPKDLAQSGPARILGFSTDPYHRDFSLCQEREQLVLRLRTPATGENGSSPETNLARLEAGRAHHVIVSYSPGRLACYVDGKRVLDTDRVQGDFSNWTAQHLLFGDEWQEARLWAGRLEGVAIHSRVIGADEAAMRHALARKRLAAR